MLITPFFEAPMLGVGKRLFIPMMQGMAIDRRVPTHCKGGFPQPRTWIWVSVMLFGTLAMYAVRASGAVLVGSWSGGTGICDPQTRGWAQRTLGEGCSVKSTL